MEGAVSQAVCEERHKNVDKALDRNEKRLNAHSKEIDDFGKFAEAQTQINQQILQQLQDMQEWQKKQDNKLPNRVEYIVRQVVQWATLGLLALIASRIGL